MALPCRLVTRDGFLLPVRLVAAELGADLRLGVGEDVAEAEAEGELESWKRAGGEGRAVFVFCAFSASLSFHQMSLAGLPIGIKMRTELKRDMPG
jgi:hypothetical protein